jgi:hypothetical protein
MMFAGALAVTILAMLMVSCWEVLQRQDSDALASETARPAPGIAPSAAQSPRTPSVDATADVAAVTGDDDRRTASAEQVAGHQRMLVVLDELRKRWGDHPFSPDSRRLALTKDLAAFDPNVTGAVFARRMEAMFYLGTIELKLGLEQEAIDRLTQTLATLNRPMTNENTRLAMFWLGVAYLRLAETQNCCSRNTPDSCVFPIRGQGIHSQREGSTKAIECLTKVVKFAPRDSLQHQNARWLINVAYMTLGEYPHGVPTEYVLPPSAFASDEEFPRFPNVSKELGLNALNYAGGVVVDDLNSDGRLDVLVSSMDLRGQLRYWTNEGDGKFTERTREAGLTGLFGGLNMIQADYNNDGHIDILVLRGAWMDTMGAHPNSLLRNNGDGTFTDVTFAAGMGDVHYPTQSAAWADFDNDGDLDLYIGNETSKSVSAPSQLFRNNGDETFTDIGSTAGVTNDRYCKGVACGDFNHDRLTDIYVSNLTGDNRLYRNNGDGTFTDVAPELKVTGPYKSFPVWFWDYDNDGVLDLYVSAYQISSGHLALQAAGIPYSGLETQKLYRGLKGGGFEDVSAKCGLNELNAPMGANFGDLDNDGFLDFYLATGRPDFWELMPNVMYRNRRGAGFSDVTTAGGFGNLQKGHGVAFADLDQDGDQDIFSQLGGAFPGDQYYNAVFENPGFGNHSITLHLEGTQSNRCAIGARIRLDILEDGVPRSIYRYVGSGGSFGASPLVQAIGIGKATVIEQIEVYWPTSGLTQRFAKVAADQQVRIVENREAFAVERPARQRLALHR